MTILEFVKIRDHLDDEHVIVFTSGNFNTPILVLDRHDYKRLVQEMEGKP